MRVRIGILLSVAFVVVVLDQFVKELVLAVLEPGRFVPFVGSRIGWQLIFNPGAAFGLRLPPVIFPIITSVLLAVIIRSLREPIGGWGLFAYGLVVGGAIGNVIDRLVRPGDGTVVGGYVVDFVAWGAFPRFNVADASITVGVVLFILLTLLAERRGRSGRLPDVADR